MADFKPLLIPWARLRRDIPRAHLRRDIPRAHLRRDSAATASWWLAGLLAVAGGVWASEGPVTFAVGEIEETIYSGGPVELELRFENTGSEPAHLDLGSDYERHLAFSIRKPDGLSVEASVPSTLNVQGDEGVFAAGHATLEPGGRFAHRVLLNKWLALELPGHYVVEVRLTQPMVMDSGARVEMPPVAVEFEIVDDSEALAEHCLKLLDQVRDRTSETQREDAKALGWARHPACIPALAGLLDTRFKGLAVEALEVLGDEQAVRLLLDALERVDCLSATGILQALARMRDDFVETPLLAEIDLVLAGAQEQVDSCLESLGFTK